MFKRIQEDFTCDNCGEFVHGNGFTNHCPACLWSKHVDRGPGDRSATCGGLMEPRGFEMRGDESRIIHVCEKCGYEHKNKVSKADNFEQVERVAKLRADREMKY